MRHLALVVTFVTAAAAVPLAQKNENLIGAWTLNKAASELAPAGDGRGDGREDDGREGRRGGRRGGGGFGGGFGGGGRGGNFGNERQENREAAERMRDAMRAELEAPDHMVIVSTDTTIIITTPDGHTTRLATDGSKIKDESTGVERKTRWNAGKLVSEVSGLGRGKITEIYSVDGEPKQLRVKLEIDGPRKTSQTRVYDLDAR